MRRMIVVLACLVTPLVAGVATSEAKTKPTKPLSLTVGLGCWSTVPSFKGCAWPLGSPTGPLATFDVTETDFSGAYVRHIDLFNVFQPCLGENPVQAGVDGTENYAQVTAGVRINNAGQFSFHRKAETYNGTAPIDLTGKFLNNTTARITFWVHYGDCRQTTTTLKVKPGQVPPGKSEQPPKGK